MLMKSFTWLVFHAAFSTAVFAMELFLHSASALAAT
jgi:hypothetical protein